jgi:hypothetical protein
LEMSHPQPTALSAEIIVLASQITAWKPRSWYQYYGSMSSFCREWTVIPVREDGSKLR